MTWDPVGYLIADLAAHLRACVGEEADSAAVAETARRVGYLQAVCGVDDETRIGRTAMYRTALEAAYQQADLGEARLSVESVVVRRLVPGLSASIDVHE